MLTRNRDQILAALTLKLRLHSDRLYTCFNAKEPKRSNLAQFARWTLCSMPSAQVSAVTMCRRLNTSDGSE